MINRKGQTWQEQDRIFVVVGPPTMTEHYNRHPVCFLDAAEERVMKEEKFVDEGEISWEDLPYMTRIG